MLLCRGHGGAISSYLQVSSQLLTDVLREDRVLEITCPDCCRAVEAEDLNINSLIGKCSNCNSVFSIADQLGGMVQENKPSDQSMDKRPSVAKPDSLTIDNNGITLSINYRWSSIVARLFLTFFCAFWDTFMIVWFGISISTGEWGMAAFGSIHGLVGVGLTYTCAAMWVNSTNIKVDASELSVVHGPLPWPGALSLNPSELKQLYTVEIISRNSRGSGSTYSYELQCRTEEGKRIKLVTGLQSIEHCLYLEQQIEEFLEIEDKAERGEVSRC